MATDPVWRQAATLVPGEYVVTCLRAEAVESAAGNPCIKWVYAVGEFELAWTTVRRRKESGIAARALGMHFPPLRLSEAAGRQCRVTVKTSGGFFSVESARAL